MEELEEEIEGLEEQVEWLQAELEWERHGRARVEGWVNDVAAADAEWVRVRDQGLLGDEEQLAAQWEMEVWAWEMRREEEEEEKRVREVEEDARVRDMEVRAEKARADGTVRWSWLSERWVRA